MAVPTVYNKLIDYYEKHGMEKDKEKIKKKLKKYRLMVSGSSALSEKAFRRW